MKTILTGILSGLFGSAILIGVLLYTVTMPNDRSQLAYPLDAQSVQTLSKTLDTILLDKIFNLQWKKLFHYLTAFESVNPTSSGFYINTSTGASVQQGDGTAPVPSDGTGVRLITGTTSNNVAEILKTPGQWGLTTFNQKSNFRSAFSITDVTNVNAYIIVGKFGVSDFYGFLISGGNLYGATSNGTNESDVPLQAISPATNYNIEARYEPNNIVNFYVNDKLIGSSTTFLPRPTVSGGGVVNPNILDVRVKTLNTTSKTLKVSFFEYLQYRNILK